MNNRVTREGRDKGEEGRVHASRAFTLERQHRVPFTLLTSHTRYEYT